ncbi:MAG: TonB-dependent receptor, partial [Caulobacteraceae bacterium]
MSVRRKSKARALFRMGAGASVFVLSALGGSVMAQTAPASAAPQATELQALTVTAERRTTNLQVTPVAATVLTSQVLEDQRIVNMADVAINVPNLTYTQFSSQESYFSIRGTLINNNAAGYDDAVSVFIDDVPATGLGDANPDLFDLSSIEVLRGPQGTLFGRNVTGGAVVVHTQPPSFTPGGKLEATYGSHNYTQVRGLLTGPLVADKLAGKLSLDITHEDNWVKNVTIGGGAGGTNYWDLRGQLLWRPAPNLDVLLGADYLRDRSGGYATRILGTYEPAQFPNLCYTPYCTNQNFNGYQHRDVGGALARVNWTTNLGVVTSITGWRYVNERFPNNLLGDPLDQIFAVGLVDDRQVTQEIRLASPSNQRFTYVVGGFFLYSNKREGNPLTFNVSPNGVLAGIPTFTENMDQKVRSYDYAVFGEGTFAFTDQLKLTLGARETYEKKTGDSIVTYNPLAPFGNCPGPSSWFGNCPGAATYSHGWSAFTPRAILSFQPTPELYLYASASRGFKSGGYDLSGQSGATTAQVDQLLATPFQPETVWSYEVGEKWTGFDHRLIFDVDAFRADYTNLQTNQITCGSGGCISFTQNAAGARTPGIELESTALPADWLTLGLTYAFMDAKFTNFPGVNGSKPNTG